MLFTWEVCVVSKVGKIVYNKNNDNDNDSSSWSRVGLIKAAVTPTISLLSFSSYISLITHIYFGTISLA